MNGHDTIVIALQCYLRAPEDELPRFEYVCDLFLSGLENGNYDRPPTFDDLEVEIDALALAFGAGTVADLWTILVNWWDTVKWARRYVRAFMEKDDLLADVIKPIVTDIMNRDINRRLRRNYQPNVLHTLLQRSAPAGYRVTPYPGTPPPTNVDLNAILSDYRELSDEWGFNGEVHILLQLLFDKMMRNEKRHANYIVNAYRQECINRQIQPSFRDYVARRELLIRRELFTQCERLFLHMFNIEEDD